MKKGTIIITAILALLLTGCTDKSGNKDLDGIWQVMTIQYSGSEEKEKAEQLYYSFQLDLMQVRKIGSGHRYGQYTYTGDSIHVWFPLTTASYLQMFAVSDTLEYFGVDYLKRGKMTLRSDYATMELRKY